MKEHGEPTKYVHEASGAPNPDIDAIVAALIRHVRTDDLSAHPAEDGTAIPDNRKGFESPQPR